MALRATVCYGKLRRKYNWHKDAFLITVIVNTRHHNRH
jgi:hypothetical protein